MKWTRAVHHLEALAQTCADMSTRPASIFPLRVTQLWAAGEVLSGPRDLDVITVALCVDLPAPDVPWLTEPAGSAHWASATRLSKLPALLLWRSAHAPVWNHFVDRPVLLWSLADGIAEEALAAVREGRSEHVRLPAPTPDELRTRLDDELAVSLSGLRTRTRTYEDRRWAPGRLEPVADALWQGSNGYLDVLDALRALPPA
ncbi:MAG: hypothetical protein M3P96_11890 [Actinomycetota bacterium]|nr:hypothetical protein [Actinomycetota bacterium]